MIDDSHVVNWPHLLRVATVGKSDGPIDFTFTDKIAAILFNASYSVKDAPELLFYCIDYFEKKEFKRPNPDIIIVPDDFEDLEALVQKFGYAQIITINRSNEKSTITESPEQLDKLLKEIYRSFVADPTHFSDIRPPDWKPQPPEDQEERKDTMPPWLARLMQPKQRYVVAVYNPNNLICSPQTEWQPRDIVNARPWATWINTLGTRLGLDVSNLKDYMSQMRSIAATVINVDDPFDLFRLIGYGIPINCIVIDSNQPEEKTLSVGLTTGIRQTKVPVIYLQDLKMVDGSSIPKTNAANMNTLLELLFGKDDKSFPSTKAYSKPFVAIKGTLIGDSEAHIIGCECLGQEGLYPWAGAPDAGRFHAANELYDLAEKLGADPNRCDACRTFARNYELLGAASFNVQGLNAFNANPYRPSLEEACHDLGIPLSKKDMYGTPLIASFLGRLFPGITGVIRHFYEKGLVAPGGGLYLLPHDHQKAHERFCSTAKIKPTYQVK